MRDERDLIEVRLQLVGRVSLDMERIEADPNWKQVCATYDMSKPWDRAEALRMYIINYVTREQFLKFVPSTNGPGELRVETTEVTYNGSGSGRDSETGGAAEPA